MTRLELLAVVNLRPDPAWIEAAIAERAETQQSANSPQEVRRRPMIADEAQRCEGDVFAGQPTFPWSTDDARDYPKTGGIVPLQRVVASGSGLGRTGLSRPSALAQ